MTKVVAAEEVELGDILEDVKRNDEVLIMQDGRAIARVVPVSVPRPRRTLEELRKSVRFIGDVESPVDDWDVKR